MSPEQVRGQAVDHPSDIFSLGAVLYEMATGAPAFKRETAAETMTAILRDDPLDPPAPASGSGRPAPGLERTLRHCLEKNPEERFQSARDLAYDLESLSGSTRSGAAAAAGPAPARLRIPPLAAAAAALALLAAGFLAGRVGRPPGGGATSPSPTFKQLTFQAGALHYPSVSPEGQSFVFVKQDGGDLDIFAQRTGGANAVNLTADSPKDDSEPAFSPDGSQIAFRSERDGGGLFVMGATGESVRRLTDSGYNPAWSPDGREIVYGTALVQQFWPYARATLGPLWAVDMATGGKRRITDEAQDAVQPSWSPHGQRIAFWGLRGGGQRDLWTIGRSGDPASLVSVTNDPDLDWNPVWSPDGRFLYFSSDRGGTLGLWRVPVDEASGRPTGPPQAVAAPFPSVAYLSFTRDGSRLFLSGGFQTDSIVRVGFDAARARTLGEPKPIFSSSLRIFYASASVDGGAVAFTSGGRQEDVFTLRGDGAGLRQLTNDPFKDRGAVFFGDGKRLLLYSNRSGQYDAWSLRLDGSGATQLTRTEGDEIVNIELSADDRMIVGSLTRSTGGAIARIDGALPASPEALPAADGGAAFMYPSWSRDGAQLAGILRHPSGRRTLGTYSLASKKYRALDVDAEDAAFWVGDDTLLFLRSGELFAADAASGAQHRVTSPEELGGQIGGAGFIYTFALSRDQRSLFLVLWRNQADVWQLTLS
jgi:Tol biopolymer transport system component